MLNPTRLFFLEINWFLFLSNTKKELFSLSSNQIKMPTYLLTFFKSAFSHKKIEMFSCENRLFNFPLYFLVWKISNKKLLAKQFIFYCSQKKCAQFISFLILSETKLKFSIFFFFFILEPKKILSISRLPPSKRTLWDLSTPSHFASRSFLRLLVFWVFLAWKFGNRMIIYVLRTLSLLLSLSI